MAFSPAQPFLQHTSMPISCFDGDCLYYCEFIDNFDRYIAPYAIDDGYKLLQLESLCKGEAKDVVSGLSRIRDKTEAYQLARSRLASHFGDRTKLMCRVQSDLLDGEKLNEWDGKQLMALCDKMFCCENTFKSWGKLAELNSPDIIEKLFNRLPYKLKTEFISKSSGNSELGDFSELRKILERAAKDADSYLGQHLYESLNKKKGITSKFSKTPSSSRNFNVCAAKESASMPSVGKLCCLACGRSHQLWQCDKFKGWSVQERSSLVKAKRLCFNCLKAGHGVGTCYFNKNCSHCNKRHHTLLHQEIKESLVVQNSNGSQSSLNVSCSTYSDSTTSNKKLHKVVPIKVWIEDPGEAMVTWASMDEGSETSLCTLEFAKKLGAKLDRINVEVCTNNGVSKVNQQIPYFHIKGLDEPNVFKVSNVLVQKNIINVNSSIPNNEILKSYARLKDLQFLQLASNKVEFLLGQTVQNAFCVSELRYGAHNEPHALHTSLGWALWENHLSSIHDDLNVQINCVIERRTVSEKVLEVLNQDFKDIDLPETSAMSIDDKRALDIFNKSLKKESGHYKLALPWKKNNVILPNNRTMAESRLTNIKKKLLQDSDLQSKYCEKMQEYLDCKFVSVVPDNEIPTAGKTWYVPHHCVSISSKFRIVFDCSAKYQGTSLNDNLLQGPDLTNSLVGVFLRFRQEPIAVVGDIKSMFYQVFVSEQDRDALRFLWYPDGDLEKAPVDHRMNVHVFGSTSSPSAAAFALRRVAEDNASNVDPFVIETVLKNFYVDDLCKSCSTVNEAVKLLDQLCRLLKNGGFHLTKFLSNSKDVLRCIPPEDLASSVAGSCDRKLPTQKALGVYWNAETDKLESK